MTTCGWCGNWHGSACPRVKSMEFYPDGITVKRVEFVTLSDLQAPVAQPVLQRQPWQVTWNDANGYTLAPQYGPAGNYQ